MCEEQGTGVAAGKGFKLGGGRNQCLDGDYGGGDQGDYCRRGVGRWGLGQRGLGGD